MENDVSFGKVKLSVLLERKFGDMYSVGPDNKKLFVTVIGLARKEQADCPLTVTIVRDQGEDNNNTWIELKKIIVCAAEINLIQQKAIVFLKESDAKEQAGALKASSVAVSIARLMATTVLTAVAMPYVQSQHSTSSVVMVVVAETTPLMAGHIFRDFLISTHSKKLPIHESMKKIASGIAHKYVINFRMKDTISLAPFNGGIRHEWTRAINTNGGVSPRSVQRYIQCASDLVDTTFGGANVTVGDKALKRVASNVGPSLLKFNHGYQPITTSPEYQLLLQQTGMMSGW
jgi:hypothetical protein